MKRFTTLFFAAMAVLAVSGKAAMAMEPVRYDLRAEIEPAAGMVAVQGTIIVAVDGAPSEMTFALHRTFVINKLSIAGKRADFSYQDIALTPFNPATRNVVVKLPAGATRDGTIHLDIAYDGKLVQLPEWGSGPGLAMDDQVNPLLVELASYSSWYPQFGSYGTHFQSDLEISVPQGWTAISGGAKREMPARSGHIVTHWSVPDNFDLVITAAPNFRVITRREGDVTIEIYHTQMPDAVVAREADLLAAVITWFKDRLGAAPVPGGTVRHIYGPMKHGQGRAGIARAGEIVTSEGRALEAMAADPNYTLFQDIAHEIGHFWWNFGSGQGDWINEAFAEYFSALSVRALVSEQQFESGLEKYNKNVRALPPGAPSLATVPAQGGDFVVRYQKGSLMLDDFRRTMGDEPFFQASRDFYRTYKERRVGTAEFRWFWGARLGAARVDAWIDFSGGVPALP